MFYILWFVSLVLRLSLLYIVSVGTWSMVSTQAIGKDLSDDRTSSVWRREGERSWPGGGILGLLLEKLDWQHSFLLLLFFVLSLYFLLYIYLHVFRRLFSFLFFSSLNFFFPFFYFPSSFFLFYFFFPFSFSYFPSFYIPSSSLFSSSFHLLLWMRDTTALSVSVWIWVRLTSLISSYLTFGALSWGILSNQRSGRGWTGHLLSCGGTSLGDLALVVSTFRLALCNYTLLMSLGTYAKRISLGYNEVLIVLWLWFYYRRRI